MLKIKIIIKNKKNVKKRNTKKKTNYNRLKATTKQKFKKNPVTYKM